MNFGEGRLCGTYPQRQPPAIIGRTLTDPPDQKNALQHGVAQLVLSLMTGHSTWVTLRVKPPKSSRSLPVRFVWSRSAGTPSRWSSSERNGYMRKVISLHLLAL